MKDGVGKQQHEPHDELRQDIGHHVPCGDGEPARTETGGGRDEIGGCALSISARRMRAAGQCVRATPMVTPQNPLPKA
ncbi:MAG: hypothetical protein ACLSGS_01310 [Adlercreutzia sp.]